MDTALPEDALQKLGLDKLEPEEQDQILEDLHDLIFEGTLVTFLEMMEDGDKEKFSELLEKDSSEEEVMAFIASVIPNADEVVQDTVQAILEDMTSLDAAVSATNP